jgi:hypothetical protein
MPQLTHADLQAGLDAARQRLHEIVIFSMKTWLPEEMWKGLKPPEASGESTPGCMHHPDVLSP